MGEAGRGHCPGESASISFAQPRHRGNHDPRRGVEYVRNGGRAPEMMHKDAQGKNKWASPGILMQTHLTPTHTNKHTAITAVNIIQMLCIYIYIHTQIACIVVYHIHI